MKIQKIVSNYLESNVFVLTKGNDALIVDAGADIDKVKKAVGDKKVCGVLLTHGHYDHSLYCKVYAKEFSCKLFASENIKSLLADGHANYSEGNFSITDFSSFVFVKDGQEIQLGEFEIKCIETKGHSKCSMCYLVFDSLFAGDTLFQRGIGRTDLIGGDKEEMYESLTKLDQTAFETVYSGHGQESSKDEQTQNIYIFKKFLKR